MIIDHLLRIHYKNVISSIKPVLICKRGRGHLEFINVGINQSSYDNDPHIVAHEIYVEILVIANFNF